ncbi:MAG: RNA-binding protein [Hyphomicrobiaceae bacterium]|nr:RNA-binding protein [Hyphomicrobiaceae bacterium]
MPKGPKGEKRPADVIANAIKVARIATGEEPDEIEKTDDGKDKAAVSLGKRGGRARAESLSPQRRAEIAKKASVTRWKNSEK